MKHWKAPDFVEIRMDAEINCYSSALPEYPKDVIPKRTAISHNLAESTES
jgi:coenzyme PQQ precursor peptide PqqA